MVGWAGRRAGGDRRGSFPHRRELSQHDRQLATSTLSAAAAAAPGAPGGGSLASCSCPGSPEDPVLGKTQGRPTAKPRRCAEPSLPPQHPEKIGPCAIGRPARLL